MRLLFDSWPLGLTFCYLGPLVQAMSVYVSTLTMVVIAIDRHQMLLGSMLLRRFTSSLARSWTLVLIWILSAIFSIPHFIFNRVVTKQTYTCVLRCEAKYPAEAATYSRGITIFQLLSQYLVPLTIICKFAIVDCRGLSFKVNLNLYLVSLLLQSDRRSHLETGEHRSDDQLAKELVPAVETSHAEDAHPRCDRVRHLLVASQSLLLLSGLHSELDVLQVHLHLLPLVRHQLGVLQSFHLLLAQQAVPGASSRHTWVLFSLAEAWWRLHHHQHVQPVRQQQQQLW